MKQSGHQRIHAPRHTVWAALNDTRVLKRCIEGCESFESIGEQSYKAILRTQLGPLNALFAANVQLAEEPQVDPDLQNFRLVVQLERTAAGFGRGEARISLTEESSEVTMLSYQINAVVGGKLAQLGARLVESAAGSLASSFFRKLQTELGGRVPGQSKANEQRGRLEAEW